jgi:transglutaminase-like putative cysteine protease
MNRAAQASPGGAFRRALLTAVAVTAVSLLPAGCGGETERVATAPSVVTADIQAGIEKHIEKKIEAGGGHFVLPFGKKTLRLKLVKVHTEYLANLGPRRHFACVDLVDVSGDVYDVDFFLAGDPGSMKVTETTVHKLNGQPYYAWQQARDRTWKQVPVEKASERELGVVKERDEFEFTYRVFLPEVKGKARMWVPLASSDRFQRVEVKSVGAPGRRRTLKDAEHGNRVLVFDLAPGDGGGKLEIVYVVKRLEKKAYAAPRPAEGKYTAGERLAPVGGEFRKIAEKIVAGKKTDLVRARALYDHVIDNMRYIKHGPGWGRGDAVRACSALTGNCTDYHAYFMSLARSVGIPARFAVGAGVPSARDEGRLSGYHCWVEFYADGKWWPVDISEGDKYSSLATYYFGHHPANRIELSRGRDIVVDPGPVGGPINFLAYPVLEVDGRPVKARTEFWFRRINGGG